MRDEQTPKDVCGEARISIAGTILAPPPNFKAQIVTKAQECRNYTL